MSGHRRSHKNTLFLVEDGTYFVLHECILCDLDEGFYGLVYDHDYHNSQRRYYQERLSRCMVIEYRSRGGTEDYKAKWKPIR